MEQGKICDTPCEACNKRGLPIYPVRYAIAPANANAPALSGAFKAPAVELGADAGYTARLLRPGYLYMYDEARSRWEGYVVTESGYCVPFPVGRPVTIATAEKPLEPCARDSRQEVAAFITISSPKQATTVWLGFSDVMWTPAVLRQHEDAAWRARHMRRIDVAACLGGGGGDHIKPIAQLESSVAEYGGGTRGPVFSFSRFGYLAARKEKTQALVEAANNMYENKGVIIALDDPPGVQQELSDLASARLQFFMDGEGGKAPERARKAMVSSAIVQLRGAIENQAELEEIRLATQMANKARDDMGIGLLFESVRNATDAIEQVTPAHLDRAKAAAWEKYPRKYNEPERAAWQAQYDEALEAFSKSKLDGLAKAHVAWMKSQAMVAYMACNFDAKDAASGAGYAATIHACTRGTAGMQPCFDAYLEALSADTAPGEASIVMNALIFNQDQLKEAARSATEIDARDVPWDTIYGVYAAAVTRMGEGNASQVTQLIHELSGPLAKVVSKMIDGPAKLIIGILSLHAGAPWIKVELKGSRKDFRRLLVKRIVELNGELNPRQIKMAVDQEMKRLVIRGEVTEGHRGAKWITLLDARQIKGLPAEGTVRAQGLWLRGRMQTPEQLYALETKAKFGAWRNLINTDVRMGTISGILQVASLTKLVSDEQNAMAADKSEARGRLGASLMAITGTVMEVTTKMVEKLPMYASALLQGRSWVRRVDRLAGVGRALGVAGAVIMAGWDVYKAFEELKKGNVVSGSLYAGSGIFGALLVFGLAVAWNPLLLAILVAALVIVGWLLERLKDNKIQTWLEQCIFGNARLYDTWQLEMSEFQLAIK